ncbi:hypothetical protein [Ktedonospora formicarum]|uniref:hypothetical protein n=1 Tax=Ktedonospora formicarum TaxID=2778364 RepID=UPI001C68FE9A|nr:hypothetical protein [Ktedonospora formicarum]
MRHSGEFEERSGRAALLSEHGPPTRVGLATPALPRSEREPRQGEPHLVEGLDVAREVHRTEGVPVRLVTGQPIGQCVPMTLHVLGALMLQQFVPHLLLQPLLEVLAMHPLELRRELLGVHRLDSRSDGGAGPAAPRLDYRRDGCRELPDALEGELPGLPDDLGEELGVLSGVLLPSCPASGISLVAVCVVHEFSRGCLRIGHASVARTFADGNRETRSKLAL